MGQDTIRQAIGRQRRRQAAKPGVVAEAADQDRARRAKLTRSPADKQLRHYMTKG